jgi:hypothetical protein
MPSRIPYLRLFLLFLVSRLFVVGAAFASRAILEPGEFFGPPNHWLDYITRWDASWYISIVEDGYAYKPGAESNVAFFPLYPLLLKAFSWAGDIRIVGLVVSNACLLLASFALWALASRASASRSENVDTKPAADAAVALFLFTPVTFFFSILYTESTFFLLAVCCLLAARTGRWWVAFLAGYAAALTRSTGLLLVIPLFMEYHGVALKPWQWARRLSWRGLLLASGPVLGIATYAVYLQAKFGDALLFSSVQRAWKRSLVWPWQTLTPDYLRVYAPFYLIWFLLFLAVGIALLARGFFTRFRPSLLVLGIAMVLLYLSSGRLESIPRYLSVVAPLFLIAGEFWVERPHWRTPIAFLGGIAGFMSVALFINGYWFT